MINGAAGSSLESLGGRPRRVAFFTFGCKLNQCETAGLRAQFPTPDYAVVPYDQAAHIYIINTCSVTGRADAQARQLVRRTVRERPGSRVVVTGCYAQRAPKEVAAIPGVTLVAGNGEKDRLREIVERVAGGRAGAPGGSGVVPENPGPGGETPPLAALTASAVIEVADLRKARRSFEMAPVEFGERSRAYLRVQDGCDAGCTFCIIPRLRGRSTSLDATEAVRRVAAIVAEGYREVILTGIHLGMFGHDRGEPGALAGLIDRLTALPGEFRLRLSSIEPQEIDDALIARIAAGERLVPHLHVPLQSGCDRTLAAMNRTYRAAEYADVVERLVARVDPLGLGADVIVGFPGETDADFEETYRFIAERPFSYLHVFPFSPRAGTRAATLPGRPPGPVVDERGRRLRALSDEKARAFAARLVGRMTTVLVEEPVDELFWAGWNEFYARVRFPWPNGEDLGGRFVRAQGTAHDADGLLATPEAAGPPAPGPGLRAIVSA